MKSFNVTLILFFFLLENIHCQENHNYNRDQWINIAEQLKPVLKESIINPAGIIEVINDTSAFQGWNTISVAPMDSVYNNSFKKIKNIIIDFGDHYTGYFTFKLKTLSGTADGPLRFKLTFGEVPSEMVVPFDPYPGDLSRAWLQDEVITVMDLPATLTLERRISFRYLKIELLASSPFFDFAISDMEFKAQTSATHSPEALSASTPELIIQIDRIGQNTLKECMQTVYEDGPKRDRRLWVGDLYLEAKANTYSFENHDLTKRCLYLLAGLTDEKGYVLGTAFETPKPHAQAGQRLMDYSLLFNAALFDYVETTGDYEAGKDLWPVAKRQLSIIDDYLNEEDLVNYEKASRDWWVFIDWKENLHKQAAIQGVMIYCLKKSYELAKLLGSESEVEFIPGFVNKMIKASKKNLFNRKTGLFESGPDKQISYASQVWMILAGVLSEKDSRNALSHVVDYEGALKPGGPYMYHYFIQALVNSGMSEMAKKMLTGYWGGMIEKGADTFWEVYDPENDFLSPYNFYPLNSYCHAWSCTPVYYIRKYPGIFQ